MIAAAHRVNGAVAADLQAQRARPAQRGGATYYPVELRTIWERLGAMADQILILEAKVHGLEIIVENIDATADYAASLGESAERRLSA